jgi:hypothetical protein
MSRGPSAEIIAPARRRQRDVDFRTVKNGLLPARVEDADAEALIAALRSQAIASLAKSSGS